MEVNTMDLDELYLVTWKSATTVIGGDPLEGKPVETQILGRKYLEDEEKIIFVFGTTMLFRNRI